MTRENEVLDEVRAQRLVVVDEEGRDRVVAEVRNDVAEVKVMLSDTSPGRTTAVSVVAGESAELGAVVGLAIMADGDSMAETMACRDFGSWRVAMWRIASE